MVRETLQPGDICITHEVFLTLPAMIFRSQASDDSEACKQAVRGTKITNYVLLVLLPSLSNHVISNNVPACVYGIISHDTLAFFASSDPPKDIPLLYHEI